MCPQFETLFVLVQTPFAQRRPEQSFLLASSCFPASISRHSSPPGLFILWLPFFTSSLCGPIPPPQIACFYESFPKGWWLWHSVPGFLRSLPSVCSSFSLPALPLHPLVDRPPWNGPPISAPYFLAIGGLCVEIFPRCARVFFWFPSCAMVELDRFSLALYAFRVNPVFPFRLPPAEYAVVEVGEIPSPVRILSSCGATPFPTFFFFTIGSSCRSQSLQHFLFLSDGFLGRRLLPPSFLK